MKEQNMLRKELSALLRGGNAHMSLEEVLEDFPLSRINDKAPYMPYSPWHILEHMRRVQQDIVAFIQDPGYISPDWPEGFFPSPDETVDKAGWRKTLHDFQSGLAILDRMAADPATDLLAPIPHAQGYSIYREILLAADHNAYHTGELAFMRQVMNAWPPGAALYDAE